MQPRHRLVLGSVAESVMGTTHVPVLAIPTYCATRGFAGARPLSSSPVTSG